MFLSIVPYSTKDSDMGLMEYLAWLSDRDSTKLRIALLFCNDLEILKIYSRKPISLASLFLTINFHLRGSSSPEANWHLVDSQEHILTYMSLGVNSAEAKMR